MPCLGSGRGPFECPGQEVADFGLSTPFKRVATSGAVRYNMRLTQIFRMYPEHDP